MDIIVEKKCMYVCIFIYHPLQNHYIAIGITYSKVCWMMRREVSLEIGISPVKKNIAVSINHIVRVPIQYACPSNLAFEPLP